jgi:hypothetical protein
LFINSTVPIQANNTINRIIMMDFLFFISLKIYFLIVYFNGEYMASKAFRRTNLSNRYDFY